MNLGTVMPFPKFFALDANGAPLSGGLLYTYAAGTSTPLSTYTSSGLTIANTNPVVLDSAGRAVVFLSANTYKFTLMSALGVLQWTVDGVASTGLSQSIVGIGATAFNFGGAEWCPITNTTYASGTTADKFLANSAVLTIDSSRLVGTFGLNAMIQSISGQVTTLALVNLSDGSPNTPIATITSTSTTGESVTGTAITFAAAGADKLYAVKPKTASSYGFIWGASLVRLA